MAYHSSTNDIIEAGERHVAEAERLVGVRATRATRPTPHEIGLAGVRAALAVACEVRALRETLTRKETG